MKRLHLSIKNAIAGLHQAYLEEPNMRFHIFIALLVVIFGYLTGLNLGEWLFVGLAIILVIVVEVINTIFERMIDMVKPTVNEYVRGMKDMMASAVLLVSLFALAVGLTILMPKVIQFFGSLILLIM